MSRAIVVQLGADQVRAVVARAEGNKLHVDAVEIVPVVGTDLTTAEKQLAAALEDHHPSKAKVLLAVPSNSIKWQYLTLPPCPPEDLPALVKLQLDLESSRDEDSIGYDFLPLAGSPERPQRVLAMVLKMAELARVRNFGRVSGLRVDAVVPLVMGWPALQRDSNNAASEAEIIVACENKEVTIWATHAGELALLRQVQVSEEWESPNSGGAIAGQLRRTMLSLAQEGVATEATRMILMGEPASFLQQVSANLTQQLNRPVEAAPPAEITLPSHAQSARNVLLPLVGLAHQATGNEPPTLDFLHPRKPPAPRSNRRTMVLGGIAAALLAAIVGWQGYVTLNQPLWAAEQLEDELYTVRQELEPLEAEERDAARIRDWLAASPNVLTELAELSRDWRPQPFDSMDFKIAEDGVLKRIDINNRRVVLTGNVANSAAVQPLENRLRDGGHRVRREQSEPATDGGQYPWQVQIVVDVVDGQPVEAQP